MTGKELIRTPDISTAREKKKQRAKIDGSLAKSARKFLRSEKKRKRGKKGISEGDWSTLGANDTSCGFSNDIAVGLGKISLKSAIRRIAAHGPLSNIPDLIYKRAI